MSVEGSLLLHANPKAEGVCHKSIDRVQLFTAAPEKVLLVLASPKTTSWIYNWQFQALGQLANAYELDAQLASAEVHRGICGHVLF